MMMMIIIIIIVIIIITIIIIITMIIFIIFLIRSSLCSFCSYIHNPGPCILGGWPLCVEWASSIVKIAPQDSDRFYSSLKTLLFSRARVGSTSE